jgi:hypothetical protein
MGRAAILFLGGIVALLAAFALKGALIALPPVAEAPAAGEFDANRAFARLERVLADQRPHPVDSPGSDGVRDRLLAEMRAVGLQPRMTDKMVCSHYGRSRGINCARVRNLAATIGPAEGEHLLIVAHYDSVPVGPGASDAGIAIATMLEVAEQLRGRRVARPITFLFNEGEESGLLGARAFLEQDPAAPRVATLINLEARGVEGPAIMFETSRPNEAAIRLFGQAVARPVANSLSTDFYRLLPNSTDVAVFEERPWTILNFAIIGNETRYHSAGDDLASLDRRSLQHMGRQALAAASLYGSGEAPAGGGELIYADVLNWQLVAMPLVAGLILLGLIVFALAAAVWLRRAFGRPLVACMAAVAGSALLAWLVVGGVQLLRPGDFYRAWPIVTHIAIYASALLAIAAALSIARRSSREQLRSAAWLAYAALGAVICAVAPGAAIYFLFAPLVVLGGMVMERWRPGAERMAGILASLIQLLTLLPVLALMELLLSTSPGWVLAPVGALAALPLLVELAPGEQAGRPPLLAALGFAAAAWAAVLLTPAYSEARQQIFTIENVRNAGTGTAEWGVYGDGAQLPAEYRAMGEWRRDTVLYARRLRWLLPAPVENVPSPTLVRLGERRAQGGRIVAFQVAMNGWDGIVLNAPPEAQLRAMSAGGTVRTFGPGNSPEDRYVIRCAGRSCDGLRFDLLVGSAAPVEALVIGNRSGLPTTAAPLLRSRPANARPQYVPDASYVLTPVRL